MSRQLVVLGEDWGAHPSSTQHLIRRLLPDYRVLWVNSIGLRTPGWRDLGRIGRKFCAATTDASPAATPPGMEVLSPLALPWHGQEWVRRVNGPWLARQIRRRAPWLERPLLWLSLPSAIALAGHLGEQAIIYYCGDDFGALEGVDHAMARECEQALVARASLIIAASPALAECFPAHKTRLLPHGVDLDRFSAGGQRPADLPRGRPIAGFYGSLSSWIDLPLLAETARALPHWDLVLIGPHHCDLGALRGIANIHLLGPRPHAQLPAYLHHWQVSLLPFRDTPQIRTCNPLKLREYLAAGKPVVSTDFPALDGYREQVVVAERTPQGLAKAITRAALDAPQGPWLEADTWSVLTAHGGRSLRRQQVSDEGWTQRGETLKCWLHSLA
ncbi:glycosyltransferase [Aeromonas sp. R6-2]|uniref:glycosyltransferase n=1 Tax=Aeromonas sp. R6-2 TaxID=3138472 RepID=UPI0034A24BCC